MLNYITSVLPNSNSARIHLKLLEAISLLFVLKEIVKKSLQFTTRPKLPAQTVEKASNSKAEFVNERETPDSSGDVRWTSCWASKTNAT